MTIALRASARAVAARLPSIALALACLGAAGDAAAGQPGQPGWSAARGVLATARERGLPGAVLRLAAEEDERADLPPGARVTRDEAASIALKVVAGEVTSVDVERKLGKIVYTVEIMTPQGDETDVFVDIENGAVLGTE